MDEARDVAADVGVAHPSAVHGEAPDLAAIQVLRFPLQAFLVVDELTGVVDDACVLVDRLEREDAPAMELGAAAYDARPRAVTWHVGHRIANARDVTDNGTHMSSSNGNNGGRGIRAGEVIHAWGRILAGYRPNLSIEITKECPLRCPGCYAYGEEHLGGEAGTALLAGLLERGWLNAERAEPVRPRERTRVRERPRVRERTRARTTGMPGRGSR